MADPDVTRGIVSNTIGLLILGSVAAAMNLGALAIVALAVNWAVFLVHALPQNSEKFFDATGSITYLALVASAVRASSTHSLRQIINPIMVAVWCIRLGSFLLARILRDGKDSRFDEFKKSWIRFLGVWTIQAVWCFLVSSPALVVVTSGACGSAPGALDFAGWGVWLFGFVFEVVADRQKAAFRSDPANKGMFITTGLWAYSRHPNYFGEVGMWVGMCLTGSSCFSNLQWLAWLSPVTTWVLLTKVSGVPLLEAKGKQTWGGQPEYEWYMENTPCIVPACRRPPAYAPRESYVALSG